MFNFVASTLIFILGLVIGSLLNCIIYRLEKGEGFLFSRSYCPHCKHTLAWSDLIPVLSFIALRGKCRYCQQKISWQYPAVETSTGSLFLLIFNFQFSIFKEFSISNFQTFSEIIFLLTITSFLIIIFVYDLKHYIIPDKVIYPAVAITFLRQVIFNFQFSIFKEFSIFNFQTLNFFSIGRWGTGPFFAAAKNGPVPITIIFPLFAAILASVFFLAIVLISRGKWMGLGDVKLAFLLGLLLGWPNILVALFFAFLSGAIVGTGLVMAKKKTFRAEVPFGPFLAAGAFFTLFFGGQVIHWYLNLFLW